MWKVSVQCCDYHNSTVTNNFYFIHTKIKIIEVIDDNVLLSYLSSYALN